MNFASEPNKDRSGLEGRLEERGRDGENIMCIEDTFSRVVALNSKHLQNDRLIRLYSIWFCSEDYIRAWFDEPC